jgi:hypothetical protein
MKLASFEAIVEALNRAEVRFIVVDGIAVIAHGYGRNTEHVDLVIRLEPTAISNAFAALQKLGYQPRVPITATQFADADLRAEWIRDKGMRVLTFHSDLHRETPVDLFISEPFDFEQAGRRQDLADVDELNLLHGGKSSYDR